MAVTQAAPPSPRRRTGGRVAAVVAASIAALVALGLLAGAAGAGLWAALHQGRR